VLLFERPTAARVLARMREGAAVYAGTQDPHVVCSPLIIRPATTREQESSEFVVCLIVVHDRRSVGQMA